MNKRWTFNVLLAVLMLMLFAKHVLEVPLPEILFIGISVFMVCGGDRDQVLAMLAMCIPLGMVFSTVYTCIVGIAAWLVRYKNRIHINLTIVPILFMILWELLHCFFGGFSIKSFVALWIPYLICAVLMWQDVSDVDYAFVVRCLAVCMVAMCVTLLGMVLVRSNFSVSRAFMNMQRLGQVAEGASANTFQINPNSLGIICTLATSGLLQLMTTGKGSRTDIIMTLIMVVCGALTTSRTFVVLLLTMALLLWLGQEGSMKKKLRVLAALMIAGAISFAILTMVFPTVLENYIIRFGVADLTSGRGELFRTYNHFLFDNPNVLLFGVGQMDFGNKVVREYAVAANVPHNGIQEVLVAWGIPGLMMILAFLCTMLYSSHKTVHRFRLLNFIPLLLLLLKIQVGQMISSEYTMLAFSYAYLSLCADLQADS